MQQKFTEDRTDVCNRRNADGGRYFHHQKQQVTSLRSNSQPLAYLQENKQTNQYWRQLFSGDIFRQMRH
jgi:hypothetical protein